MALEKGKLPLGALPFVYHAVTVGNLFPLLTAGETKTLQTATSSFSCSGPVSLHCAHLLLAGQHGGARCT